MKTVHRDGALAVINPHREAIVAAIRSGFEDYFQKYADELSLHSQGARTRLIYDHIKAHVRTRFASEPSIRFVDDRNQTFFLVFGDDVVVRFKKFDKHRRTANVRTIASRMYRGQEQMSLFPKALHLYAGYETDDVFRNITGILLVCPNQYGNKWEVYLEENDYTRSLIPMGLEEAPESIPTARLRLKGTMRTAAAGQS